MAILPAEVPTGLVTGQFYFVSEDNIDADTDPELLPVTGDITFTSSAKVLRMPGAKVTVIPRVFKAKFDAMGNIRPANAAEPGLKLPATDTTEISPRNYTWKVEFDLKETGNNYTVQVPSFDIQVPAGTTVDLTTVMPVDQTPGTITIAGPPGTPGAEGPAGPQGVSNIALDEDGVPYYSPGAGDSADVVDGHVVELLANPASATSTVLSASYAPASGSPAYVPVVDSGKRWAAKHEMAAAAVNVGLAGDSTGDVEAEWFRRGWGMWLAEHPAVGATYKQWDDPSQAYVTSTAQTAVPQTYVNTVLEDTFTRTAGELKTTLADTGQVWGGNTAMFSINGTSAVSLGGDYGNEISFAATGSKYRASFTITIDSTPGATQKMVSVWLGVSTANRVRTQVSVSSAGVIAWGIYKITGGTFGTVAVGTGTALTPNAVQTVDCYIEIEGTTVRGGVASATATGTLNSTEAAALAVPTKIYMLTEGAAAAGVKFDKVSVGVTGTLNRPQSLTLYNGSLHGSVLSYQQARLAIMYPVPLDLLFISSCHNYGTDEPETYLPKLEAFINAFRAVQPQAGIIIGSQNPQYSPVPQATYERHQRRMQAIRPYAESKGFGYLPAAEAFYLQPDGGSTFVQGDGIHPTTTVHRVDPKNGSYLWATVLKAKLDSLTTGA